MGRQAIRSSLPSLVILLLFASCADPAKRTQVMLILEADRAVRTQTRALRLQVWGGPAGTSQPAENEQFLELALDDIGGFPVSHALVPQNNDASRRFRVEASALDDSNERLGTVRAISGYLEGKTLVLRLRFYSNCLYVDPCENPLESCGEDGSCVGAQVEPLTLQDLEDAPDAGTRDVGAEGCSSVIDCDDGVACTRDTCRDDGTCVSIANDELCTEMAQGRCDPFAGCQYGNGCNEDNCVSTACEMAQCNGDTCERTSLCRLGESCCGGMCTTCNDGNLCTDDACGGDQCTHTPNGSACNDMMFCNGADTCGDDGMCSEHEGNPCMGMSTCDEAGQACTGCAGDSDCPSRMETPVGSCQRGSNECSYTGSRSVMIRTFSCVEGTCQPADMLEPSSCPFPPNTVDGNACGSGSSVTWSGDCQQDVLGSCMVEGTEEGMEITPVCDNQSCAGSEAAVTSRYCEATLPPGCNTDAGMDAGLDACNPEICGDGLDNDCDSLRDCNDSDCFGDPFCQEPDSCVPSDESAFCDDDIDNDCDGNVDCADSDCDAFCMPPDDAGGDSCFGEPESDSLTCSDRIDNDCDLLFDCADPDCDAICNDAGMSDSCVPLPEDCEDGFDNDCDLMADCDDPDCDVFCGGGFDGQTSTPDV